jgi:hypothetical protein
VGTIARLIGQARHGLWRRAGSAARAREFTCYLLGTGALLTGPRCSACGHEFAEPRRGGEKFRIALEIFNAPARPVRHTTLRMLMGERVLFARTAPELAPLLERAFTWVGERTLVGIASTHGAGDGWRLVLFCRPCGESLVARLTGRGAMRYAWDWMVDFTPRRVLARLSAGIGRKRAALPWYQSSLKFLPVRADGRS